MIQHWISFNLLVIFLSFCIHQYFFREDCNQNLRLQLKSALQQKIETTEENLKLAKLAKKSEERYIDLLLQLEEVHTSLRQKSLKLKEYMEENQELKEENAMLKYLIQN